MLLLASSLLLGLMPIPSAGGHRTLSSIERDAGWTLLFDGSTTTGWRGIGKQVFPDKGWEVVDGSLHRKAGERGGDIITTTEFGDFELEFEWKVAPGANSGVKYRVRDQPGQGSAFGPEYQVLDDGGHQNGANPKTSAGSLYAVMAAEKSTPPLVGEWNTGRIVCYDGRIEHWVNGEQLFDVELSGETWTTNVSRSKFKGRADFASAGPGRIALQDHGDEVWYRNLRLRELPAWGAPEVTLLSGDALDHWYEYGDAIYEAEEGSILGRTGGGGQSFLITKETFGDFVMEVDVMPELPGNSGIQIRSHEKKNKRPFGYQIEIDSSDRAWSGGLFDEARRGWLQDLKQNPAGREAFRYQGWNRFRIECVGPWIKTWVNGVPVTDYFDTADLEGFIALQVHSGNNTRVRWRNPRVWDLGERSWVSVFDGRSLDGWEAMEGNWSVEDGVLVGRTSPKDVAQVATGEALENRALSFEVLFDEAAGDHLVLHLVSDAQRFRLPGAWKGAEAGKWHHCALGVASGRLALELNGRTSFVDLDFAAPPRVQFELCAEDATLKLREMRALSPAER